MTFNTCGDEGFKCEAVPMTGQRIKGGSYIYFLLVDSVRQSLKITGIVWRSAYSFGLCYWQNLHYGLAHRGEFARAEKTSKPSAAFIICLYMSGLLVGSCKVNREVRNKLEMSAFLPSYFYFLSMKWMLLIGWLHIDSNLIYHSTQYKCTVPLACVCILKYSIPFSRYVFSACVILLPCKKESAYH